MSQVLEVHDSEIIAIGKIMEALASRYSGAYRNYLAFEREAMDLFARAGLVIAVNWHGYSIGGVPQEGAMPEITVTGRLVAFDPDRQVHEVTQNILELPGQEPGEVIKTDRGGVFRDFREGGGAGHGHSHSHPH